MKNYDDIRKNFLDKYVKNIQPFFKESEAKRKKLIKKLQAATGASFAIGILALIFPLVSSQFNSSSNNQGIEIAVWQPVLFILFSIIFPLIILLVFKKIFEFIFKENSISIVNTCFQKLHRYQGFKYGIADAIFKNSLLVDDYNSVFLNNVFKGEKDKITFEILETKLTGVNKIKKIFNGIIIKINLLKPEENHIIIRPQNFSNKFNNINLAPISINDVVFKCKCDIFANNKEEARKIITAEFAQCLNDIARVFKAQIFSFALYKNNLLIALYDVKNILTPQDLFKPVENNKDFSALFDNIISIYKLIDLFELKSAKKLNN